MNGFGLDPDLHNTGWAIVNSDGPTLLDCGVCKVPAKLKQEKAAVAMGAAMVNIVPTHDYCHSAVVEGQQVYLGTAKQAHPQDLIQLAYVSGAAAIILGHCSMVEEVEILKPSQISTVKKAVRQARAFTKLGIPYKTHKTKSETWCYPEDLQGLTKTQWKHVADAVFIALFAAEGSIRPGPSAQVMRKRKFRA